MWTRLWMFWNSILAWTGMKLETIVDENPESRYQIISRQLTYEELEPYYAFINSEDEGDQEVSQYVKGIWYEDD